MPRLHLPSKRPTQPPAPIIFEDVRSLVIVGANGSGKSRMGHWIETNNRSTPVHRISAQRALLFSDLVVPKPYEQAASELYYGAFIPNWNLETHRDGKFAHRWKQDPLGQMLTDYDTLLQVLFADEARRDHDYTRAAKAELPDCKPPDCALDKLQNIWSNIFTQRELIIDNDKIRARLPNAPQPYAGRQMSDGERVALYLIGQVLACPTNAIIVVNEPDIHLHRAIQGPLWDQLELNRQDCIFVYITHDLEFAVSRSAARKIWVKRFDGSAWEWEEIIGGDSISAIPERLFTRAKVVVAVE